MNKNNKFSVVDMFKAPNEDKPKVDTRNCQEYLNSKSIWNQFGISAGTNRSTTYRNKAKELPLKTLMANVSECKIITNSDDINVSVSACNRIQSIDIYNQSLSYENCTKIVDVSDKNEHSMRVRNGYKIYDLYRYNPLANNDTVYMTICVK